MHSLVWMQVFRINENIYVQVCLSPTFNLDSRGVGSSRLLPPSPPVLTETLGLWDEGAQRVFLEPVRVFEREPLPILPLGEHKFHYIHFLTALESRGLRLQATALLQSKTQEETRQKVSTTRGKIKSLKAGGGEATSNQNTAERLTAGPSNTAT